MEVKNRIGEALALRNMKQVDLVERTGIAPASINSWVKNRWQPKSTPLHKMAKVLNVSELWLAGYDVPMEKPAEQIKAEALATTVSFLKENERYQELINSIIKLDEDNFILVEKLVKQLSK